MGMRDPARIVSRGLHALLDTAPWALERLRPFAGQTLVLNVGTWTLFFTIDERGSLVLNRERPPVPALTLDLSPSALPLLLLRPAEALHHLHLSGNSALATEIGFLARHFRPDLEELLSRAVGDRSAHRLGLLLRQGGTWARETLSRSRCMLQEYATEEIHLLPSQAQARHFARQVHQLDEDLGRLEQRLGRLR
ncbi:SCP2 sterol-binding domain-containing protein [Ferrovum sp.]|uniref:ubiquinone biosynthesis accessory factor UbiJ n=1 Tax=Ferrovum sp. TaxID=2609467 RepID=UPI002603CB15|nr:SCP2 sterol-binding domain-containing protein [Ferrovum sp.]